MKTIFTNKNEITAKNGSEYVIFNGFAENGEPVQAFLSKAQAAEFGTDKIEIVDQKTLKEMFENLPTADVDFNQRGRVVAITV